MHSNDDDDSKDIFLFLGYVFEESRLNFMTQPDGSIAPYTTLSYANGLGMGIWTEIYAAYDLEV